MPRHLGFKTAKFLAIGQTVTADKPSPLAPIYDGAPYEVAAIEMDDSMGYVRVVGVEGRFRPYLFKT